MTTIEHVAKLTPSDLARWGRENRKLAIEILALRVALEFTANGLAIETTNAETYATTTIPCKTGGDQVAQALADAKLLQKLVKTHEADALVLNRPHDQQREPRPALRLQGRRHVSPINGRREARDTRLLSHRDRRSGPP